jgi:hypothetical protein
MKQKKSGWSTDWTKPSSEVTPQKVNEIGGNLKKLIEESPEKRWNGTIRDLMAACGEHDEKEYGTYFNALSIVREKYNIKSKSAGRNGNWYYFDNDSYTSNQQELKFPHTEYTLPPMPTIHVTISVDFPEQTKQTTYSFTINPLEQIG